MTTALAAGGCSFFAEKEVKKFETQFGTLLVMDATQANTFYAFSETIIPKGSGFPDVKTAKVMCMFLKVRFSQQVQPLILV